MTLRTNSRVRLRSTSSAYAGAMTTLMTFVNMAVGFGFQAVIAASLGVSALSDSFQLGWTIVTFGTVTIFSMVSTLLVPRMQMERINDVAAGNAWLPIAAGAFFCLVQFGISAVLGPNELSTILAWSAPASLFAGLAAAPQAIAYIQKRFVLAAMGPVANGLALLGVVGIWFGGLTPQKLGIALAVGYLAQFLVVTIPLLWDRPELARQRSISVIAFVGITAFTLLAKFQPVVERILSSMIAEGATTALGFGQKVAQGLLLVSAFGLALTATASLSRHINADRLTEAAAVLARTLVATVFLATATISVALPLSWPATVVLFLRGNFTTEDAQYVTAIIIIQLPWVFAGAVTGVLTSYLYVQRSYFRVVGASAIGIASTLGVTALLAPAIPLYAVAAASSVGGTLTLGWAIWLVTISPIGGPLKLELLNLRAILTAAGLMVAVATASYAVVALLGLEHSSFGILVVLVSIALAIGGMYLCRDFRSQIREVFDAKI